MPVVVQAKPKHHGLWAVVGVVVLAVVTIVGIGAWVFMTQKAASDKHAYDLVVKQSDDMDNRGNYRGEAKALEAYLMTKPPAKYGNDLQLRLATTYSNAGMYAQAVDWFKRADATDASLHAQVVQGLANSYAAEGKKDEAINYYKQAIEIAKKNGGSDATADEERYNTVIHHLETGE